MKLITLDYETYYSKEFSLSKISTEDYVNDPRFEVIGVGLKIDTAPTLWHSGDMKSTKEFLYDHRVHENAMIAQNTMFDQLINQVHFGIYPPVLFDTMSMAQALLKPFLRSVGLAAILKHLDLGVQKGTYVSSAIGKRRLDFSDNELREYGDYCIDDCDGERAVFDYLVKQLPRPELELIDLTLRMYLEPTLELDRDMLEEILCDVREEKQLLMNKLPPEVQRADLMSNPKLAKLLEGLGVDVPMKQSPTTGKQTWAFAKTDPEWKDMEEDYEFHPVVAPILAARSGVKSTLAETRTERLLEIATKYRKFRIPLRYYAAHTGRYGGMQSINCQNFPRINQKKGRNQLRHAIRAPKHHVVLAADLAQIEARINAWLSGCQHLLQAFREKRDVYSEFSSLIHGRTITKADELERFIGKTCILGLGYGMGSKKLRNTLRKDDIKITEGESCYYVGTYRTTYAEIPQLWTFCNEALEIIAHGGKRRIGPCMAAHNAIVMPNGMSVVYNNLRWVEKAKYEGWVYDFGGRVRTIWGGKVVENIVQTLARIKIMSDMRAVRKELDLKPALQAHDELVYCVLERDAEMYAREIEKLMAIPPDFAPDLPVMGESGWGITYGDAK